MNTNGFRARFDKLARDTFARHGLADIATYNATDASAPLICTVQVDRGLIDVGERARSKNAFVRIKAFRAEIGEAPTIDVSTFVIGSERFLVVDLEDSTDESAYPCIVRPL